LETPTTIETQVDPVVFGLKLSDDRWELGEGMKFNEAEWDN